MGSKSLLDLDQFYGKGYESYSQRRKVRNLLGDVGFSGDTQNTKHKHNFSHGIMQIETERLLKQELDNRLKTVLIDKWWQIEDVVTFSSRKRSLIPINSPSFLMLWESQKRKRWPTMNWIVRPSRRESKVEWRRPVWGSGAVDRPFSRRCYKVYESMSF